MPIPLAGQRQFKNLGSLLSNDDFANQLGSFVNNPQVNQLSNVLSGKGLNLADDTGSVSVMPGGSFNVQSNAGLNFTGNPAIQSVGIGYTNPQTGNGIGLSGSWNKFDPSIQAQINLGKPKIPMSDEQAALAASQSVNQALTGPPQFGPEQLSPAQQLLKDTLNKVRGEYDDSPTALLRSTY